MKDLACVGEKVCLRRRRRQSGHTNEIYPRKDREVAMGFYERKILPEFLDMMMKTPENEKLRLEGLAPARGRLLEVGFGSGLNVAYYPKEVTSVVGIEPNL